MKVVLTPTAIADLEDIGEWIARDSPANAARFLTQLRQRCLHLGEYPKAYPLVPRYEHRGIRRRPFQDYLIFYRASGDRVEILHVLHGARDYEPLLFPSEP